jgi:hypothetical protein
MTTYKNFRNALMALLGVVMLCFTACKEDKEENLRSKACDIVSFTAGGETWTISGTDITKTFPYGTDVTALAPTITLSEGATVSPASGAVQDFSAADGVIYTVTAEDGTTTKTYTAKATVEPPDASDACDITAFTVNGEAWTISGTDITKAFPAGTDVIAFTPTITVSEGATVSPASGAVQDFSSAAGVIYTVTAEDGTTTKTYTAKIVEPATLEVTLSSTDLVPATGGTIEATVTTTGGWAVTTDKTWVTFDPARGSGDGKFTITVAGHDADEPRTTMVTVRTDDGYYGVMFEIRQDRMPTVFPWTDEGNFAEKCVGVRFFWSGTPFPALYYKYTLLKKGKLNIQFEDSHIHTFMMDREPGYYENLGGMTFSEQPTQEMDYGLTNAYDAVMYDLDEKNGDVWALCPRSTPQNITFHLAPGTYWTTHTLELNVAGPDCSADEAPIFDGFEEDFVLTVTFTPDPDE